MLLRNVRVEGRIVDVRIDAGRIAEIGAGLARTAIEIDGAGGALIPGLHDHHMHLLATAAASASVPCGPPDIRDEVGLIAALRGAGGSGWIRGVGYDEAVAGDLDRKMLDSLAIDRPIRIQHRSGALWIVNSAARELLGRDVPDDGRLWRQDAWLRERLRDVAPPPLHELGHRLASFGITGVTDATPGDARALAAVVMSLPQHIVSLGDNTGSLTVGPRKIVLGDHDLPGFDALADLIGTTHASGRAVAVHSVTRDSALLLLAVLASVGTLPGDRIEHGAVLPHEAVDAIERLALTVVTQPSLVRERGDDYLRRVDPADLPHLWRCGSLVRRGVPVGLSSDAPYGHVDPWSTVATAVSRLTHAGVVLGADEAVGRGRAIDAFLCDPLDLRSGARRVEPGRTADLVLLTPPSTAAVTDEASVRTTLISGKIVYDKETDDR